MTLGKAPSLSEENIDDWVQPANTSADPSIVQMTEMREEGQRERGKSSHYIDRRLNLAS